MNLTYINPFIYTSTDIIKQVGQLDVHLVNAYLKKEHIDIKGKGVSIELDGTVKGEVIFDFLPPIASYIVGKMTGSKVVAANEELLNSGIQEFANFIAGNAVPRLKANNYSYKISTPKLIDNKKIPVVPKELVYVVLEFSSKEGNFFINITHCKKDLKDNIRILLLGLDNYLTLNFAYEYLSSGYLLFHADDEDEAKNIINAQDIDFLLLNADKVVDNIIEHIDNIVSSSQSQTYKIILHLSKQNLNQPVDLVFDLQNIYRVIGTIIKEDDYERQASSIKRIMQRAGIKHLDRRMHIRVKPENGDKFFVKIDQKHEEPIIAHLNDLSIGGTSFNLNNLDSFSKYNDEDNIEFNIILNDNEFIIKGKILKKEDNRLSIQFVDPPFNAVKIISRMVLNKLKLDILANG